MAFQLDLLNWHPRRRFSSLCQVPVIHVPGLPISHYLLDDQIMAMSKWNHNILLSIISWSDLLLISVFSRGHLSRQQRIQEDKFWLGWFSDFLLIGIKCAHWPKVGPEHRILANPMQEFVGRTGEVSQHHEYLFHHYKKKFRKTYKNKKEIEHRRHNFIHNMR